MAGIYGILIKHNNVRKGYDFFYNSRSSNMTQSEVVIDDDIVLGRVVLRKFSQDRFFYEDKDLICCFEGINYSENKSPSYIIKNLLENKSSFLKNLKGVFTGFLFNKSSKTVQVFNDQLSTKNVYYYHSPEHGLIFSTRLYVLTKIMRENHIPMEYNLDGIYSLALYGQLFNDSTIIKNVYKLEYGSTLTFSLINPLNLNKEKYFELKKEEKLIPFDRAIGDFDELMRNSIQREWNKDKEYGFNHISLLSGGMDARTNVMIAKKLGFKDITTYSYGNPNSSDLKIAQHISGNEFFSHLAHCISNGEYLGKNIEENYIKPSDGMTLYPPSATMKFSLEKLNFLNYGALHSGQIGDVVFGSFLRPKFNFEKDKDKIGLNGFVKEIEMIDKVTSINKIIKKYKGTDYEMYAYEQRQINGTLTGDRVASNLVDHVSPYYDIELNQYLLSLPNEYKINQKFYYSWLHKYYPEILNYKWEKIDLKPNHPLKVKYGYLGKKYYNGFKKYFKLNYDSMNPITNWVDSSPVLLKALDEIFHIEIEKVSNSEPELAEDLTKIYRNNLFEYRNKFAVITVLLSLKLHFRDF